MVFNAFIQCFKNWTEPAGPTVNLSPSRSGPTIWPAKRLSRNQTGQTDDQTAEPNKPASSLRTIRFNFFFSSQHPRSYSHCRRSLECRLAGSSPHALESPPPKCCKAPSPATQPPIPRGCSHCCRQCLKYQKILAIFLKNRGVRVREI